MSKRITATYQDAHEADAAIERLVQVGFPSEDISIITTSEQRLQSGKSPVAHTGEAQEPDLAKGAADGGIIGGTLGVIIAGTLAATAAGSIGGPLASAGAEILSVAGPIAAAFVGGGAGAAAGAVAGGAVGFLMHEGVMQDHEAQAASNDVVVAVDTDGSDTDVIRTLLNTKTTVTSQ